MVALIFLVVMVSFLIWKGDFVGLAILLFIGYLGSHIIESDRKGANRALNNQYFQSGENIINDSVPQQKASEERIDELAEERAEEYAEDYYNYLHEGDEDVPDFEYDGCVSRRDIPDMLNEIEERYEEEREKREDW